MPLRSLPARTPRALSPLHAPLRALPACTPRALSPLRALPPRGPRPLRALPFPSLEPLPSVAEASAVLAAIVVVHESGHFLAALLRGIRVSKFAVGFGPPLLQFTANQIEFSLRAVPLGGFVAFPDPDDPSTDLPPDHPDLLRNRPLSDRFLVISSGVLANLLSAYLLLLLQTLTVGLPVQQPLPGVLVPSVLPSSPAASAGLLPGDLILSAGGGAAAAPSVPSLVDLIKQNPNREVVLNVERRTTGRVEITVVPEVDEDGTGRIGVQLSPNFKILKLRGKDLGEAVGLAGREFWRLAGAVTEGLRQTAVNFGRTAEKVAGPVAIIAVGAEVARSSDGEGLFQFAAVINLNLAVINMLPLPALDGGSLALLAVEAARGGRKIPKELEQQIMASGITVALFLGMFLIVRDTLNLDFVKQLL